MIVIQITHLLPRETQPDASTRKSFRRRGAQSRNAISKVAGILQTVADEKNAALVKEGINPDDMDESIAKQSQLEVLSDFIFIILKKLKSAHKYAETDVRNVAKAMNVNIDKVDLKNIESDV